MIVPRLSPLLRNKMYEEPSIFNPEDLLREARRQKNIYQKTIPEICILDPDGDIAAYLIKEQKAVLNESWACYHTQLYNFVYDDLEFGIIGCVVGASFAVLVSEELFASGCRLVISMTSAGQIVPIKEPPYFILIEKALRDEGTSHHYLPPSEYGRMNQELFQSILQGFRDRSIDVYTGATWTTDAPFRETEAAIQFARDEGILAVEMEASALYAFSQAKKKPVICMANITNQMGSAEEDFEKGPHSGAVSSLRMIYTAAHTWLCLTSSILSGNNKE